ncbi:MAG: acyl-CoA dehydrogenase family protein, partial [Gammaproteobacteria bacterium]
MSILTKMQELLQLKARDLAQSVIKERAAEVDRSEAYPWNNIEALTQAGFMGMTSPEEFGGQGLDYMDAVLVIEEMAKVCG